MGGEERAGRGTEKEKQKTLIKLLTKCENLVIIAKPS